MEALWGKKHVRLGSAAWVGATGDFRNNTASKVFVSVDGEIAGYFSMKSKYRPELVEKITYWTGVKRPIVNGLIDSICRTCERMKLWGEVGEEPRYLVEVTALATTLAMNFLTRGKFEH